VRPAPRARLNASAASTRSASSRRCGSLAHIIAREVYVDFVQPLLMGGGLNWTLQIAATLVACYAFHLPVERPSHLFARELTVPRATRLPARA